ncbi:hypothetical protein ACFLXE_04440 [Chloroflexota bacterium]
MEEGGAVRILHLAMTLVLIISVISAVACDGNDASTLPSRSGYKIFSKYGLSFEFPDDCTISEHGVMENQANDTDGVVLASSDKMAINVYWTASVQDLFKGDPHYLNNFYFNMEQQSGITDIEREEWEETVKLGHQVIYERFSFQGERKLFGIYGVWYCSNSQRMFDFVAVHDWARMLPLCKGVLESVHCH